MFGLRPRGVGLTSSAPCLHWRQHTSMVYMCCFEQHHSKYDITENIGLSAALWNLILDKIFTHIPINIHPYTFYCMYCILYDSLIRRNLYLSFTQCTVKFDLCIYHIPEEQLAARVVHPRSSFGFTAAPNNMSELSLMMEICISPQ